MSDILGIEKKRNLRDLGGYKTQNSKHVKKGYFFRSSRLMDFDQAELEILNSLNIKKIYDLRSKEEVKDAPDPELLGAEYIHLSAAIHADGTEVNFSPAALIAENVYSKESNDEFTPLNIETALNEQPDIILRTAHAMPDTVNEMFKKEFENNKSWSHFEAVKNNKVIDLDSSIFGMTATFDYQKGLEELAKIFYAN